MNRPKGMSESRMARLWREAVLTVWPYDPFDGTGDPSRLQCHHIIYRRYYVTRWDWRNGMALSMANHQRVHGIEGNGLVIQHLQPHHREYLMTMNHVSKKEYLYAVGMSEAEFLEMRRNELEHVIHVGLDMNDAGFFRVPEAIREVV
jgi:hypothetical protein